MLVFCLAAEKNVGIWKKFDGYGENFIQFLAYNLL